mgnify:CR=1 FL=1
MNYSIIIPLYNEGENIKSLHNEILNVLEEIKNGRQFELIYIDDGSTDNTFEIISNFESDIISCKIIKNKKNFSQSISLTHGIENSTFENLIMIDGDGQNDPKDLVNMVEKYESGYDLVHGYRKKRQDNFFFKTLPSLIANFFVRILSGSKIKDHGCSLKIINKKFLIKEKMWGDFHRLLAARLSKEKIKTLQIETNHRERKYGKSNYGLSRIFKVIIDLIYMYLFHKSYSNFYVIGYLGFLSLLISLFAFIYMIKLKFINNISFIDTPLPLVTSLFGLSSLIFFSFMFIIQTVLNIKKDLRYDEKDYDIFKK